MRSSTSIRPQRQRVVLSDKRHRRLSAARYNGYDAAATVVGNENHFKYADSRDADSIILGDLPTLRNRTRYEVRNNCYATGIIETKANDLVGVGPTLQLQTGYPEFDNEVETKFANWCRRCDIAGEMTFGQMLWLGITQIREAGGMLVLLANTAKPVSWVRAVAEPTIRLHAIEIDRLATPMDIIRMPGYSEERIRDGIEIDEYGRPVAYYILRQHPGSQFASLGGFGEYDRVTAENVIHFYFKKRPGQTKGVPNIQTGLPIYSQMRRWTLATLSGAETAANFSGVLEGELSGNEEQADFETMDEVEVPRNALMILPEGRKLSQLKPEQPTATYEKFKHELINEASRSEHMPYNIAAGNSSDYNYASGRLDHQTYFKALGVERGRIEAQACNPVFYSWLREALMIKGFFRKRPGGDAIIEPAWFWPGQQHVDPVKEAVAQKTRLANLTTNLKMEYAMQGLDWEREIRQKVKEVELLKELGLIDEKGEKEAMENIARAVRAGVPVGVGEARTSMGLAEEPPNDKLLRFNDQDVLQYHIESGVLTINEVRSVLGLPDVAWGNKPVRKAGVATVSISGEKDPDESEEVNKK